MEASEGPLIGRVDEAKVLQDQLGRSSEGVPTVAFVEGDVGIGKTRLLTDTAVFAGELGAIILKGTAPPPVGQPLPFALLSRLLRDILRQLPSREREQLIAESAALGTLQPGWRLGPPIHSEPISITALCEQLQDVVSRIASERPLTVLVLDDLQWADTATLDLISYLASGPREERVALLLAARVDDTPAEAPVRRLRSELLRSGAVHLRLAPLEFEEAEEVLSGLRQHLAASERRRIAELAMGNPLFLRELAAHEQALPGTLPETLLALVGSRLTGTTETQRAVLRVVAVASDGIAAEMVLRVAPSPVEQTLDDMRALTERRLLRKGDLGTVEVAHPLVREVINGAMLEPERQRIHAAIARALAAEPDLDPRPEVERLVRLADHWHAAGDRVRALPALVRAAKAAEAGMAFSTAFDLYRKTMELVARPSERSDRPRIGFATPQGDHGRDGPERPASTWDPPFVDLHRRAVDAAVLAGEPATGLQWADHALAHVGPSRERDGLEVARARALLAVGRAGDAVDVYRAVLGRAGGAPASAHVGLVRSLVSAGRAEEAVVAGDGAIEAAKAEQSVSEEAAALLAVGTALLATGQLGAGVERLRQAHAMRAARTSQSAAWPRVSRVIDLTAGLGAAAQITYSAGLGADAGALSEEGVAVAGRWGAEGAQARIRVVQAAAAIDQGRWGDAFAVLDELVDARGARVPALTLRARIAGLRGAWGRAESDLLVCESQILHSGPQERASFFTALAEVRLGQRRTDEAAAAVAEGLALAAGTTNHEGLDLLTVACRVHVEAALAARFVRDGSEALAHESLAQAFLSEAERSSGLGPRAEALVATSRGEIARLAPSSDPSSWAKARTAWERVGSIWWGAYAQARQAEVWLSGPGQRDVARISLAAARTAALSLEAAPLVAHIDSLATRARLDLAPKSGQGPRGRKATTDRALPISERELEVLLLLARGSTNREIAAELFISERTAAHHVGHIFDKLGVSSRVEAAGIAHSAGLLGDGTASVGRESESS